MEADGSLVAMGFGLYWQSPPRFLLEPLDLTDAVIDHSSTATAATTISIITITATIPIITIIAVIAIITIITIIARAAVLRLLILWAFITLTIISVFTAQDFYFFLFPFSRCLASLALRDNLARRDVVLTLPYMSVTHMSPCPITNAIFPCRSTEVRRIYFISDNIRWKRRVTFIVVLV
ncbi:hypothetical protein HU200_001202 [Digitaria exilis]|uniref:Uncharacterized protein n=1 Tax=Digitaria exilis TaxID=1010633 RepID=A0A835FXE7_9POAL|nr:hypothetical protein HU200_001202 [Digitaria exilis]